MARAYAEKVNALETMIEESRGGFGGLCAAEMPCSGGLIVNKGLIGKLQE
jgi:hypothetical protein